METLQTFFFVFQIILSLFIIILVLLQDSNEDSLSGFNNGNGRMLSNRSSSTPISKITMILFILFMLNSLFLATLSGRTYSKTDSMKSYIEQQKKDVK